MIMKKIDEIIEQVIEIKVGKPLSITKPQVLDYFLNNNAYLLARLTQSEDVQELVSNDGFEDLEDLLVNNFGYADNDLEEVKKYIDAYFTLFKPGEIYVDTFGDGNGTTLSGNTKYSNIDISYIGNDEYVLYAHN